MLQDEEDGELPIVPDGPGEQMVPENAEINHHHHHQKCISRNTITTITIIISSTIFVISQHLRQHTSINHSFLPYLNKEAIDERNAFIPSPISFAMITKIHFTLTLPCYKQTITHTISSILIYKNETNPLLLGEAIAELQGFSGFAARRI
jgi:hypothetical protein